MHIYVYTHVYVYVLYTCVYTHKYIQRKRQRREKRAREQERKRGRERKRHTHTHLNKHMSPESTCASCLRPSTKAVPGLPKSVSAPVFASNQYVGDAKNGQGNHEAEHDDSDDDKRKW